MKKWIDIYEERQSPLEFKAIGSTNYGKGMIFNGDGVTKQFILAASPDNFYSSEHMNLEQGKMYLIGKKPIISETEIGHTVVKSHLTEVGTLNSLVVNGNVNLSNVFKVHQSKVLIGDCEIDTKNGVTFKGSNITLQSNNQIISLTDDKIVLGDKNSPLTHAVINGKLSIGIQSIGDHAQLEVSGNIRFADKLFMVGYCAPSQGTYRKGDIVWNQDPKETGYVGWICIRDGNPGIWRGFGQIGVE